MPRGAVLSLDHGGELEPLGYFGQNRHAELSPAVGDHEIDRLGRHLFGGTDEVAFVFAVLGVDHDNRLARRDSSDGIFDL